MIEIIDDRGTGIPPGPMTIFGMGILTPWQRRGQGYDMPTNETRAKGGGISSPAFFRNSPRNSPRFVGKFRGKFRDIVVQKEKRLQALDANLFADERGR